MIEVTPQERAQWAKQLADRPGRHRNPEPNGGNGQAAGSGTGHRHVGATGHRHAGKSGHSHSGDTGQVGGGTDGQQCAEWEPANQPEPPEAFDEWTLGGTQVFAIASGKGGVGKSTITANLAAEFAHRGLAVGVLDADLNGFSLPRMLGANTKAEKQQDQIAAGLAHGVKLMSLGMFVGSEDAVIWRGPVMNRALEQMLGETDWGELDVLLVDLPPGTGDIAISIAKLLPQAEVVIVTTPQLAAAEVAARAGAMTKQTHQRVRGVVENLSWFDLPGSSSGIEGAAGALYSGAVNGANSICIETTSEAASIRTATPGSEISARLTPFGTGGGELVAAKLTEHLGEPISVLAHIPMADQVREGADVGLPVVLSAPETPAAVALRQLAGALIPSN